MENSVFDLENLRKTYFKMALPVVMGMVVSLVYNLADTYFIAQTMNTALIAGVSICSPVFTTLMAFGNIYGQGGSSLIARLLGQQDKDGIKHVSSFCFYIAIITGIVIGALMLLFQTQILSMIGATSETMEYAKQYYCVLSACAPIVILSFIHSNLLRCEGMATQSMIATVTGTVVNIILDPIFISVFGWGAFGAAVATIIGYIINVLICLYFVLKKSQFLSVSLKAWMVKAKEVKDILGVGIPAALTNLMQSLCVIVMNVYLVQYGSEKLAAMGIVLKVNMIPMLVLVGFAFGGVPLYGFLFGAKIKEKLNELIRFCLFFLGGLSVLFTIVVFFGAEGMIRFFLDNENIVADGSVMLRWQVAGTLFAAIVLQFSVLFQASGQALPALIMSLSRQGVLFVVVIMILVSLFGYNGILMSQFVADLVSAILGLILYSRTLLKKE
ncbi:MAG: MATE family efflux transporter [Bacillota bacterium]|nr:MATE family efflux transporter [Bacillota bacterium]